MTRLPIQDPDRINSSDRRNQNHLGLQMLVAAKCGTGVFFRSADLSSKKIIRAAGRKRVKPVIVIHVRPVGTSRKAKSIASGLKGQVGNDLNGEIVGVGFGSRDAGKLIRAESGDYNAVEIFYVHYGTIFFEIDRINRETTIHIGAWTRGVDDHLTVGIRERPVDLLVGAQITVQHRAVGAPGLGGADQKAPVDGRVSRARQSGGKRGNHGGGSGQRDSG